MVTMQGRPAVLTVLKSIQAPPPATVTDAVHLLANTSCAAAGIPLGYGQSGNNRWMLAGGQPTTAKKAGFSLPLSR